MKSGSGIGLRAVAHRLDIALDLRLDSLAGAPTATALMLGLRIDRLPRCTEPSRAPVALADRG